MPPVRFSSRPPAPSAKALAAAAVARDSAASRRAGSATSSFEAAGDAAAAKVVAMPGFTGQYESGEGSDSEAASGRNDGGTGASGEGEEEEEEEEEEEVVALTAQEVFKEVGKAAKKKPGRFPHRGKWTVRNNLMLMTVATKHEVWCVPGAQKTVAEKWADAHEDLEQEPYVRVFGNATHASGSGNTSADELDEDEAQLEKLLIQVVDAKASVKTVQRQERLKNTDRNVLGAAAARMGNRRCLPGGGATSFGAARERDEQEIRNILLNRTAGGSAASGLSSPASSRSSPASGRPSPATPPPVSVSPLGDELSSEMGVVDLDKLGKAAGATTDEINLFVNTGFLVDDMDRGVAVKIMEEVIKSRFNKLWGGRGMLDYIEHERSSDDGGSEVVGLGELCLAGLCLNYGIEETKFNNVDIRARWFVKGWPFNESPTVLAHGRLVKALASILVGEHYGDGSGTTIGHGDDEDTGMGGGGGVGLWMEAQVDRARTRSPVETFRRKKRAISKEPCKSRCVRRERWPTLERTGKTSGRT
ncbi:unnamed protein product [Pylaiella littoralis]